MANITGHMILKIVKGVQKIPGDSSSAEIGLDEIDLLDSTGFSCDEYDMKLPALKSSAVYADSPLSDGRTLISGTLGNVTETIRLQLTAGTIIQMAAMLSRLGRFKQDCNDFWDTLGQIEPVYLKHQIIGEPGPRYSLLYDIDIDPGQQPLIPSEAERTVILSIEREFYWRALAPGDNPKRWAIENVHGQKINLNNATLGVSAPFGSLNLVYVTTLLNRTEYPTSSKQAYVAKNFIDITAAQVPGDLPALACVNIQVADSAPPGSHIVFISRNSVRADQVLSSVDVFTQSMMLNAGDMTLGANTALAADTGAPLTQALGAGRRAVFTPADNLDAMRLSVVSRTQLNHRGTYAVFCRCRQPTGLSGEISMYLAYGSASPFGHRATTTPVIPTIQAGAGNTTFWPVTYMGVISTPLNAKTNVALGGNGNSYSANDWYFQLYARRTAGVAATLFVADFVLVPIDEPSAQLRSTDSSVDMKMVLDTTGYFQHGNPELFADGEGGAATLNALEASGQGIYLLPNTNQRLYFFSMFSDNTSSITASLIVGLNIIPRWSGLRDK